MIEVLKPDGRRDGIHRWGKPWMSGIERAMYEGSHEVHTSAKPYPCFTTSLNIGCHTLNSSSMKITRQNVLRLRRNAF
jgi:hypothetical protein